MTEDEMVGWHHCFNGHEFEPTPGMMKDREAWHAAVHGVTKGRTYLSDWTSFINPFVKVKVKVTKSCTTLCDSMDCSTPGFPIHHQLPELVQSVMPSSHLILCHPLLLLPSVFPSIRVFSNESALCTRWPKYWSLRFSISPSNEYSGLISFRIDWFDLLAVQGTLKSLHQYHKSISSSVLAFFMVKLSHPYMTTGKTISLTRRTFVGKIM